jgi:RimJ/RimL family protein N-acetyltransferase
MDGSSFPPRRLSSERLAIRSYEPGDAPVLKEAVDSSSAHLRPFMAWAWEAPEPVEVVEERLRGFREQFERGENYTYGLFTLDETELVGGAGLHRRVGPGGLEIGYWIRASRVRQGFATEAAAALTRVAFERCGAVYVEIRIDPANEASLGVPAKLGYVHEATLRRRLPPNRPGEAQRDAVVFTLLAEEYPGSAAARVPLSYRSPRA